MSEKNDKLCIVSIGEIMREKLTIPGYQRPYRWSTESALALVNDSYGAFLNQIPEYRIGSVILHREKTDAGTYVFNIVDGQQRLTTISIMLFVLNILVPDFEDELLSDLLEQKYSALSVDAVVKNREVIERKLREIEPEKIKSFIRYFLNKCTLVKIVTDNEQEAFQFFDSQNSRGKELAPHDLLKSYHLREMKDEPEGEKTDIIKAWEDTRQSELKDFFSDHLFPLVCWYKSKDGINYSSRDIRAFTGIKKSNNYNYSIYNRAANLYIERFNGEGMYELASGAVINQFQLTQPIIAGKRFFQYTLHYLNLYESVDKMLQARFSSDEIMRSGSGDSYVYDMLINVIMFYVDKFNWNALTGARLAILHKWAYSLRLSMKAVYHESVNKYAQGKNDKINKNLNIFTLIEEMQDPGELDMIVLEKVPREKFKEPYINVAKYSTMYETIFGKAGE